MPGTRGRSGGANKLPVEEHIRRNSFRPQRHLHLLSSPRPPVRQITAADRRRTLAGLPPGARRQAAALLDAFDGWDSATLSTLRAFVLSVARVEALQAAATVDVRMLHRELRIVVMLHKSLNVEAATCR